MPVIRVLQETLAEAHIDRVTGIVNGTTNFILLGVARTGEAFSGRAPREARRLGYAEADPTDDVTARTPRRRWRSSRGCFGRRSSRAVRYEGIEQITPDDLEYAREFGLA